MLDEVLQDLEAESAALDRLVSGLSPQEWSRPTPAPGWTVAHQIAHLHWTDEIATLANREPAAFLARLSESMDDPLTYVDRAAAAGVAPPDELLPRWRAGRAALAEALRAVPDNDKRPWFGTAMSPVSSATGRLMETWAHGRDIADTFPERAREYVQPTARLRHVAFIGYRTIGHGFASHGRATPAEAFRVELLMPDSTVLSFGPADAHERVTGPILDFCLLVTQRRHPADLALQATGERANEWLSVAQAFAGPPGPKREPKAAAR
ncbi:TIGR03084 family protein [Dactylosporangium vinaceum]|uniref:TIGR03084 family metal-binding protein n=1 Tax=Dactylosporangium vinaceum TaxID=53362 RepID=A0ABV5M1E2_9ACTN|nr:TIGR03084 family metal-binding protein [Dactylosporangium vinaceum]UAB97179.1 TIGR03084 family protein [Dactylosporangium vinaceum]